MSLTFSVVLRAQNNTSDQKRYVIVKSTFDFLKQVDRYKRVHLQNFYFKKQDLKPILIMRIYPNTCIETSVKQWLLM